MKKGILILGLIVSSPAFALHSTNCSSADGQTKRVEHEVWGANPIEYIFKGQSVSEDQVQFDQSSKKVLLKDSSRLGHGNAGREVYTIEMSLKGQSSAPEFVICDSSWNSALDLAK